MICLGFNMTSAVTFLLYGGTVVHQYLGQRNLLTMLYLNEQASKRHVEVVGSEVVV